MSKSRIACIVVSVLCLGASCHPHQAGASEPLFHGPINGAGATSSSTVLIVPTNEMDKTVEQGIHEYVRGIQKLITERMPGRDVKVMTDVEALQADLSQSAVSVYGTPGGSLWLAKYITALPVVIEPNAITADRLYKGSDLRFISAWPHPQNPQKGMVIYTAQRVEDVVGINGIFHGPTDFLIARGQTVLRAADYINKADRWTFPPFDLELSQATEDLDSLFRTIEEVHPNCRANLSQADYEELKERSYAALKQARDAKGRVPIHMLALTAAAATAALGDGHTACRLPAGLVDPQDPSPCMPPFRLRWDAGRVTIDKAVRGFEHLQGARLLLINGRPFDEVIAPILNYISGERQAFRMICFLGSQEVHWALVRPVQGGEMSVTIRHGTDEPQSIKVPLITVAQYSQELPATRRARPADAVDFHHDGRTCYWRYNSFDDSQAAKEAIDAVFKDIRERNAQNLVIDLRFNGGGSTNAGDHIMNYLTRKPYRDFSRIDIRLSREFFRVQGAGWLDPLARLRTGHVVSVQGKYMRSADPGHTFDGSIYVLVGPSTFSSAADFATVIQDFHIGTLVGEETGGLRQCFGDCPTFHMPHSNLAFTVSMKRFCAPVPRPDDATRGCQPDIPITAEVLAPFAGVNDPQVAFVLDLIEKRTAK